MRKKQKERLATFVGLGVIGLIIAFVVFLQLENAKSQNFLESYQKLATDSRALTQQYQSEIGKWQKKEYDNSTMISITDKYMVKFQESVYRAKNLETTEKYKRAQEFTVKSLQLEMQSYEHFRNFLATGNPEEDKKSTQLLSDSLRYETDAFAAIKAAG